jgi:hypothetical protein
MPLLCPLFPVFRLELLEIRLAVYPFFAVAAACAQISRYFHRTENGPARRNVVPRSIGTRLPGNMKDVLRLAFRAAVRLLHLIPFP